jgi:4,5-DOPA dioxygenase extradiol
MEKMPVLFIGHGSPMNALEDNPFTDNWQNTASRLPRPAAILCVSAHWYTHGSRIMDEAHPKMVYDMYGFPDELYRIQYKAEGAPLLAHETKNLISRAVTVDNSWGFDHGAWSVLHRMFPAADIPVYQLSVDMNADAQTHFAIGQELRSLREQGVLILGSGNVVHNLGRINWSMKGGQPWAVEFDNYIIGKIKSREYNDVIHYESAGESSRLAFPTPDHFFPLLYVLGASDQDDRLTVFNDSCIMGSMSMTCYLFE